MAEVICNTSPLQYLFQLGAFDLLRAICGGIVVPPAVIDELSVGRSLGIALPDVVGLDWIEVRSPKSAGVLRLVSDLGRGEVEVLALGIESADAILVLDDALARQTALANGLQVRGTLGILLDAKRKGLVPSIAPLLDQLHALRFRVAPETRRLVLTSAGE